MNDGTYTGKKQFGVTCGAFDLLHPGHLSYFREAKYHCETLIVLLQTDPAIDRPGVKSKPIQPVSHRSFQLWSCEYVDHVLVYETEADLYELLQLINPDIRFLGEDYVGKSFTGDDLNIPIYYCKRSHALSTTVLRNKIKESK